MRRRWRPLVPAGAAGVAGFLDIGLDPADYVAPHKIASEVCRAAAGGTCRPHHDECLATRRARVSVHRPAAPGRGDAGRAGPALAAHAAAVRARPHQSLAGRGIRRLCADRLRLRRRADTRAVAAPLRRHDGRATADPDRRHALPPGPRRQRRLARGTLRLPRGDDQCRVPDRACDRRPDVRLRARRHHRAVSPARHARRPPGRARRPRQRVPARRPRAAVRVRADARPGHGRAGRRVVAGDRGPRPLARARVAALRRARGAGVRRHAAAADHDQRQRVAGRAGRRPAGPLPRLARRVRAAARRHPGAAVARPAVPRHCHPRRPAARPPRGAPRRARGGGCRAGGRVRVRR